MNTLSCSALLAAAIMILAETTSLAKTHPAAFDPAPYMHAQRLVDIGERRLNLYCTGSGSPTVVFEAGGSGDMLDWRVMQPLVAKHTRVCSYDRAGSGFSDIGPPPRDADAIASDLHTLLARATIRRPFILVGHSDGELYARVYADRYLGDVAGLVFVEPALERQDERRAEAATPHYAQSVDQEKVIDRACALAEAQHRLRPHTHVYDVCTAEPYTDVPAALKAVIRMQTRRAGWWKDYVSENIDDEATAKEVHDEQRSYGGLPLVVLTADDVFPSGAFPPTEERAIVAILRNSRAGLTHLSSRGSRIEIPMCHQDETTRCASSVVTAIENVIAEGKPRL